MLAFYRGGWCPYCNIQLRAYRAVLPLIAAFGRPETRSDLATAARAICLRPRRPDELTFDVLSDVGNHAARRFRPRVRALPEDLRAALRSNDKALPGINGDESAGGVAEYPRPMCNRRERPDRSRLHPEVDYRKRLRSQTRFLDALRSLQPS